MLYFLYRLARWLSLKASLKTCYKIAVIFADIYYFFARDDRKNLESNLRIILGTDDKKLIKYMEINNFETYSAPHSKSQILMTYVESPGPSNLRIPYQDILFRDNLLST